MQVYVKHKEYRKTPGKMDEIQQAAHEMCLDGHNVVICGQAGTGKSYLLKEIVKELRGMGKKVDIVSSTGISVTQLSGSTLHKWAGIGDGRYLNEEILHLIRTDERFVSNLNNIITVDVLAVDEVSMISAKVFKQVEFVCRKIRRTDAVFGGIQVVFCGDFYQLAPVPNELYGDTGKYCFQTDLFKHAFPHTIELQQIRRQTDQMLINAVNECGKGQISDSTECYMESLDRPLQVDSVHLFARNHDTDMYNYNELQKVNETSTVYDAEDEGSSFYLQRLTVQKHLALNVGCPVVVMKNLSATIVNGLQGTVLQLLPDSVVIVFTSYDGRRITTTIEKHVFELYDPVQKIVVAKRRQIPLKLAYGLTIHKSQGLTLKYVTVHCENCVQPGQIGVAVGRATSSDGLRILNFKRSLCKQHPRYVREFYKHAQIGELFENLSCCRFKSNAQLSYFGDDDHNGDDNDGTDDQYDDDDDDKVELSDDDCDNVNLSDMSGEDVSFLKKISITSFESTGNRDQVSMTQVFQLVKEDFMHTPFQNQILEFENKVLHNDKPFSEFYSAQYCLINELRSRSFPENTTYSNKNTTDFFSKFHAHLSSEQFRKNAYCVLDKYGVAHDGPEFQFLTSVLFNIEQGCFNTVGKALNLTSPESFCIPSSANLTGSARGKIRYISGYVIAKMKFNVSRRIKNVLYGKGKEKLVQELQLKMKLLSSLTLAYEELSHSASDPESLTETARKQNDREGLTNVNDSTFSFFLILEQKCRDLLTHSNLIEKGKNIYKYALSELYRDVDIYSLWIQLMSVSSPCKNVCEHSTNDVSTIVSSLVDYASEYHDLFFPMIELFLKVNISQFRRNFLMFIEKGKTQALRKKVMNRSAKNNTAVINLQTIARDTSVKKIVSHLKLKAELTQNDKFFSDRKFTKSDLLILCKAYDITVAKNKRKDEIAVLLGQKVLSVEEVPYPEKIQASL